MRKVVPIGAAVLAVLAGSPAQAQWYGGPYRYAYPPPYYPPPPVYRPVYPPPPVYAPPVYAPPVYVPPPPQPSAALMETQRQLAQLGYDPGPVDGLSGPRLADAVQAFQRDHEQTPNGRLTGETIGAIREAARARESQSVPLPTAGAAPESSTYVPSPAPSPAPSEARPLLSVKPNSP